VKKAAREWRRVRGGRARFGLVSRFAFDFPDKCDFNSYLTPLFFMKGLFGLEGIERVWRGLGGIKSPTSQSPSILSNPS